MTAVRWLLLQVGHDGSQVAPVAGGSLRQSDGSSCRWAS